jgi:hypothetical protein
MTKINVKKPDNLTRLDKRFWDDFVLEVYKTLDDKISHSPKDIEKILLEKKWGHSKINLINKALNTDLKSKVIKAGKKYLRQ